MPKFYEQFKMLRHESGLSQNDLASQIGISKSSVNMYERGEREPGLETLEAIADFFNVDMDFLLGKTSTRNKATFFDQMAIREDLRAVPGILPVPRMVQKPLIGTIACGTPITAVQNIEDQVMVPEDVRCDFALRCKGDSMINAHIMDGALVYIREQPDVENGQIAAVLIGEDATLKRVYKNESAVTLIPENNNYAPSVFTKDEINKVRILGLVVAWTNFLN